MRKKKQYGWRDRHMRTHAEMVANCEIVEDGVREKWGRRRPESLDSWNLERPHSFQKSWKMSRQKQYHPGGRGQKHILRLGAGLTWSQKWKFEEYCRDHNIPLLSHLEKRVQYKRGIWCILRWELCNRIRKENGKWVTVKEFQPVHGYKYEVLPTPHYYSISITDGYELVWWSDKDIGIEYILAFYQ